MNYDANVPRDGKTLAIDEARRTIDALGRVQNRVTYNQALYRHLEWAKEAVWAAAYPGSADDTLLNGLEAEAENAG